MSRLTRAHGGDAVKAMRTLLTRLAQGTGPILAGPWLSEVGYELLYWIPFLAWAQATYGLDPARFVVVSRGGCASWYAHLASRYFDVLTWSTPAAVKAAFVWKPLTIGTFDRRIVSEVEVLVGPCALLHPSVMYAAFRVSKPWTAESQTRALHQPFRPVTPWPGLPDRYVAVRFYTSSICPATLPIQAAMSGIVRDLAPEPVVLLTSGARYDDHEDLRMTDAPHVHRVDAALTPATNLEVQTRVIAGASRFVGTYGGFAYLAPLLGVPADTYYGSTPALHKLRQHIPIAQRVFRSDPRYGSLSIASLKAPHAEYACA